MVFSLLSLLVCNFFIGYLPLSLSQFLWVFVFAQPSDKFGGNCNKGADISKVIWSINWLIVMISPGSFSTIGVLVSDCVCIACLESCSPVALLSRGIAAT